MALGVKQQRGGRFELQLGCGGRGVTEGVVNGAQWMMQREHRARA